MSVHLLEQPTLGGLTAHVIPVPVDMSIEESWDLICCGAYLVHPLGEPSWAAILVDEDENIVEVLR